jgi:hypothetical protein
MANRRHSRHMTTADLISMLQRVDPSGTTPIIEFRKTVGYNSLLGLFDVQPTMVVSSNKARIEGDYLSSEDYAFRYPMGEKKPIPAIVIGSTR